MPDHQMQQMQDVERMGGDILQSERFVKAKGVPHHNEHGNIARHSAETAGYALALARWLRSHGASISERDVVRASLLHDIGMTEDDVFLSPSRRKAFSHPREGARVAEEEFGANEVQLDAIRRHMWPIGFVAPHHPTGWVVLAADKYCSVREVQREAARIARYMSDEARRRIRCQRRKP